MSLNSRANFPELDSLINKPLDGKELDERLKEIMKLEAFLPTFRSGHYKLLNYLMQQETIEAFFRMLMKSNDRTLHNKAVQLTQSTSSEFNRIWAWNRPAVVSAFQCLDAVKNDESAAARREYAVNTLSQMLGRALDNWPDDICDVFRAEGDGEDPLFKKVVLNVEKYVVFHTISNLLNDRHTRVIELMWHLFLKMARTFDPSYRPAQKDRPRLVFLLPDLEYKEDEKIERNHIVNIINLLKLYFHEKFELSSDFNILVTKWLAELDVNETVKEYPCLYDLAASLSYNEKLFDKCCQTVIDSIQSDSDLVTFALGYLSAVVNNSSVENGRIKEVLSAVLDPEPKDRVFTQFAILSAVDLVTERVKYLTREGQVEWDKVQEFAQMLEEIVEEAWPRKGEYARLVRPACIEMLCAFKKAETDERKLKPGFAQEWNDRIDSWMEINCCDVTPEDESIFEDVIEVQKPIDFWRESNAVNND